MGVTHLLIHRIWQCLLSLSPRDSRCLLLVQVGRCAKGELEMDDGGQEELRGGEELREKANHDSSSGAF